MSEAKGRECILSTARQLYARAVWTHKVHEKERELWSEKANTMNRISIYLVCATTIASVLSVAGATAWYMSLATACFAAISTGFVLWQSNLDPVGKENRHRTAAKELLCARESLFLLIVRCHIGADSVENLQASLVAATRELTTIFKFAADTCPKAFRLAGGSLKAGEYSFSEDEIDALLPSEFRKGRTGEIV
jgi:hypothetical protein